MKFVVDAVIIFALGAVDVVGFALNLEVEDKGGEIVVVVCRINGVVVDVLV